MFQHGAYQQDPRCLPPRKGLRSGIIRIRTTGRIQRVEPLKTLILTHLLGRYLFFGCGGCVLVFRPSMVAWVSGPLEDSSSKYQDH